MRLQHNIEPEDYDEDIDNMSIEELEAELCTFSVNDLLMDVMCDIEKPEPWVETGFPKLDKWLDGGIRPGEVMLIAARPSVGKSAFALQLAMHMVGNNVPVTVWSLEMRPKSWIRRGLAGLSGVSLKKIRRGELTTWDEAQIRTATQQLAGKPLYFAPEMGDTTPEGFALQAQIEQGERGMKVALIDYMQLMQPPPNAHSREQEVAKHSRSLKLTANRLGISIIALAQLKRDAQGRIPDMSDLRESGALEQDPDELVFLHRDMDPETNLYTENGMVILGKNRDGETGGTRARYIWQRFAFEEVA